MNVDYVPLLQSQRKIQEAPRGMARFWKYIHTITGDNPNSLELPPLGIANPMAKEHVTALLDELLALNADRIAGECVAEASARVANEPGDFKIGLVIADDLKGGWTNRYDYEYKLRFPEDRGGKGPPKWLKHFWLTAALWSSEPASERAVREAVLTTIYRAAHLGRHGSARTLRDMLAQEGEVMAMAGCAGPVLDDDDIAYTREVLVPYLDATDKRTAIECLFGDEAGRTLGFTPRGLSHWAGLALALHDARSGATK